jgi:hypothetical protein
VKNHAWIALQKGLWMADRCGDMVETIVGFNHFASKPNKTTSTIHLLPLQH